MMVDEHGVCDRVIDDGIAEVTEVYADDDVKREGAIQGFEIARTLATREAFERVLRQRRVAESDLRQDANDDYWRHCWATAQIEWVLEVMKFSFWAKGPENISARAAIKAHEVITAIMEDK